MESKRQKKEECDEEQECWRITFENPGSLKSVTEAAAAVMPRMTIIVERDGPHYTLKVDGMDAGMTCVIQGRIRLDAKDVVMAGDATSNIEFCVDTGQLLYSVNQPSFAHSECTIKGLRSGKLLINMTSPDAGGYQDESELPTYVDVPDPPQFKDMAFDYVVEIDLFKLKQILNQAKKARAEHLHIAVKILADGPDFVTQTRFEVNGSTRHTQTFVNRSPQDEDSSRIVRAVDDGPLERDYNFRNVECVYDSTMAITHIEAFIKGLSVRMICARVKQGMPMLLEHALGHDCENSHVRFLIAPKIESDG